MTLSPGWAAHGEERARKRVFREWPQEDVTALIAVALAELDARARKSGKCMVIIEQYGPLPSSTKVVSEGDGR